jgi:hypothetical protein
MSRYSRASPYTLWVGQSVDLTLQLTTHLGEPVAAVGVAFHLRRPDGLLLMFDGSTVTQVIPGTYRIAASFDVAGEWWVRGECAGPQAAVDEIRVIVQASHAYDNPVAQSPLLVTADLWPLMNASGGLLTVARVPALLSYDIAFNAIGRLESAEMLGQWLAPRTMTIPPAMLEAFAHAGTAPTNAATLSLRLNGQPFAGISFVAGANDGSFSSSPMTTLAAGDVLSLVAPIMTDPTMADLSITLVLQRG